MRPAPPLTLLVACCLAWGCSQQEATPDAVAVAQRHLILDGHIDVPMRLYGGRSEDGSLSEDVSSRTERGEFDWVRAVAGGLDAPFMSIFVPSNYEETGGGKQLADELIDLVRGLVESAPDKFALARSPAEVRENKAAGRISLPMGMENGTPLEGKLENVAYFHGRGIRYIGLTHSRDNHLGDSSFDDARTHGGLSEFGRRVVLEMNRVGIMIDVSHLSDESFWDVLALGRTPVIASHSSCRHFTPGWKRNMSDEMIEGLADQGGVIQINFASYFVDDEIRRAREQRNEQRDAFLEQAGLQWRAPEARKALAGFYAKNPPPPTSAERVADHIDPAIALVGVDHVGLGSDFDGVGGALPTDLADVSQYPNLVRVLLARGYTDEEIGKIASGNVLRVWQAVEDFARAAREIAS